MREIKFRGKRVDDGEWVYGDITRRRSRFITNLDTTYGVSDEYGIFCAVDRETVGQFTGLYDKTGREIYEGDIIRFPIKCDRDEMMQGNVYMGNAILLVNTERCSVEELNSVYFPEVIGNIYENPEILTTP